MVDTSNSSQRPSAESSIFIDFLDPLFAVAIGIGFQSGILLEPWLQSWSLPQGNDRFNLFVFVLGILTITLSWFGYHTSIRNKPIEGNGRFILDIVLLLLYILLLFKYKNFGAVLLILAAIYLSFILWDILKILEHSHAYQKTQGKFFSRYAREFITLQWFLVFVTLLVFHRLVGDSYVIVSVAYIGTIAYRVDKRHHFIGLLAGSLIRRRG